MVVVLRTDEQIKIDVITKVHQGKIKRKEAGKILGVSERTLRRYLSNYTQKGILFAKHGNLGKTPINKVPDDLREEVMKLVRELYYDHNRTHALEQLKIHHGIMVKKDTFHKWCSEEKVLLKKTRRLKKKILRRRNRMSEKGLLLQLDGSPHKWFGGKNSCLIAAIDDSDSEVIDGFFSPTETSFACLKLLKRIIETRGIFHVLYVDKAGMYGWGEKRSGFTQVKRALGELGIEVLFAHSPEAKGRIERLFNTLQDRLIPEMRLLGIKNLDQANQYLTEVYLPQKHNSKFMLKGHQSSFKPLPFGIDLNEIFCFKEMRRVKKDHTIFYKGICYDLPTYERPIAGDMVEVRTYLDASWKVFYDDQEIKLNLVEYFQKAS